MFPNIDVAPPFLLSCPWPWVFLLCGEWDSFSVGWLTTWDKRGAEYASAGERYQAQISTGPDWNRDVRLQSKELSRKIETCVTQYCQQTRLILEHSASSFCEVSTDELLEWMSRYAGAARSTRSSSPAHAGRLADSPIRISQGRTKRGQREGSRNHDRM